MQFLLRQGMSCSAREWLITRHMFLTSNKLEIRNIDLVDNEILTLRSLKNYLLEL